MVTRGAFATGAGTHETKRSWSASSACGRSPRRATRPAPAPSNGTGSRRSRAARASPVVPPPRLPSEVQVALPLLDSGKAAEQLTLARIIWQFGKLSGDERDSTRLDLRRGVVAQVLLQREQLSLIHISEPTR